MDESTMEEIKQRLEKIIRNYENELKICEIISIDYPEFPALEQAFNYKKHLYEEFIESMKELIGDYFDE